MVEEDFRKIQKQLWDVVNQHVGPEDQQVIFALSGTMMAIAIQLYTVILQDEDIEGILEHIANDIDDTFTPNDQADFVTKINIHNLMGIMSFIS